MLRRFILCFAMILTTIFYLSFTPVFAKAAAIPAIQTEYNTVLIQLEIIPKATKSSPKLSDKIKYENFILFVNNSMCVETEKVDTKATKKTKVTYITFAAAETILLQALGYGNEIEGQNSEKILAKAAELGLSADLSLAADKQITCGEAAVLIYNSLTVPFATAEHP